MWVSLLVIVLTRRCKNAIIITCADSVNIITGDGNMQNLKVKALWINSGTLCLNEKIQAKIRKDLGDEEILITECRSEELSQHISDGYDYFLITVNRQDLVQYMYDNLNDLGQLRVLSTKTVEEEADDYDWTVHPPCGDVNILFEKLLTPIAQNGFVIDFE